MDDVSGPIRDAAHSTGLKAQIAVGGETASYADLNAATNRDIRTIVPIAAVIIFVILAFLLRSLIAPIYLLLSVGLGVLATLGATSYLFVGIGDSAGLIFMLPILLYLFVVAVGTDYNILMITRLREEIHVEGNHPKAAAKRAIEHTTSTLISAGIILAGTFASLMLAGLSLLTQMGFSVSFGIALGAFLISLILIPAISTLLGRWVWWPSHKQAAHKDR
jgi:RND superfamily putative drug exporter